MKSLTKFQLKSFKEEMETLGNFITEFGEWVLLNYSIAEEIDISNIDFDKEFYYSVGHTQYGPIKYNDVPDIYKNK